MSDFWDSEKVLASIPKADSKLIKISLCEKQMKKYINIREFYFDSGNNLRPGKSGIAIPMDLVAEVENTLRKELNQ